MSLSQKRESVIPAEENLQNGRSMSQNVCGAGSRSDMRRKSFARIASAFLMRLIKEFLCGCMVELLNSLFIDSNFKIKEHTRSGMQKKSKKNFKIG